MKPSAARASRYAAPPSFHLLFFHREVCTCMQQATEAAKSKQNISFTPQIHPRRPQTQHFYDLKGWAWSALF